MAEKATLAVASEGQVFAASRALSDADKKRLMQLSISPVRRSSVLSWTEAAWHSTRQALSDVFNVSQRDGKAVARLPDLKTIAEYPTILSIFRNNNFDIGNGRQAVFDQICRHNHACVPKAQGNFNTTIGCFTIHAIQPIDADEEITLSYLVEHGALRESRQSRLREHYGFLCDCPACDITSKRGKDGEQRRRQMQMKLHAFAEEAAEREHPNVEAELVVMRELIQLYEAEGISGRELSTLYLTAADLAAKAGVKEEALRFSENGLRIDKDCVGTDSSMFHESLARVRAIGAML
ncbi:hypothetical protein LTR36_004667 [Oleoguttula mirabilis]|uniref:SET domain-containing protein n=1 Tax=Oleoguttula mirabilis TaxID=1507867 RepID=A0AAV9JG85_9PEZI|nr:hypothetical protein LTR36_004667 [Oleoguttula mirabilis]